MDDMKMKLGLIQKLITELVDGGLSAHDEKPSELPDSEGDEISGHGMDLGKSEPDGKIAELSIEAEPADEGGDEDVSAYKKLKGLA